MNDTLSPEAIENLAEMRAAAADHAGDPEPDNEPEPEPEPATPPAPPTAAVLAKMNRDLDKEDTRHRERVAQIMGEQMAELAPCPLCPIDGFVPSQAPPDFDPAQRLAVLTAMGEQPEPELKQHPKLYRCETCDGMGDLLTGSRKDTTRTEGCPDCGGKGWRNRDFDQAMVDAQLPPAPIAASPIQPPAHAPDGMPAPATIMQGGYAFVPIQGGAPDQCGRLAGHPLWGNDPSMGGV